MQIGQLTSPFSAVNLQQKALFQPVAPASVAETQAVSMLTGKAKLQVTEPPADELSLITAVHAIVSPAQAENETDALKCEMQPSNTLLGLSAVFSPRQTKVPELEEEQFGELSSYESDQDDFMAGAVSIAPKEAAKIPLAEGDCALVGFWADVGASTVGVAPTEDDFSDWEAASDDEDDSLDELLLPWDY